MEVKMEVKMEVNSLRSWELCATVMCYAQDNRF